MFRVFKQRRVSMVHEDYQIGGIVHYQALREIEHNQLVIVNCWGDMDKDKDVQEAYIEQEIVDKYIRDKYLSSLPVN
jgi:hypothetical protein